MLLAGRMVEKMGCMALADWYLVQAVEVHCSKEERAANKEWAQINDIIRLCGAVRSFSD